MSTTRTAPPSPVKSPAGTVDGPAWFGWLPARLRADALVRALAALDPDPRRTLYSVLAGTAALGAAIGLMAVSAWLISRAAQHPLWVELSVAAVATRALGVSRGLMRYLERLISHDVALRGVGSVREHLYRRLAAADPVLVAGLRRGDLLSRVGMDVDALQDLLVRSLLPFAVSITTTLASAVLVAWLLPQAGLIVAVGLIAAATIGPWLAALGARRAERAASQARADTSAEVLALLDGVAELTVAGAVAGRLERLGALDARLNDRIDAAARPTAFAAGFGTLATGLGMVASLTVGVLAVIDGTLAPVLLAVITLTPLAAAEAVTDLPAAATGLVRARASAERVLALLEAPIADSAPGSTTESDPNDDTPAPRVAPLPAPVLTAHGLACGWPGSSPTVSDLELELAPGRRIAIVGASGCGKTTLLLTLAGLIPPVAGRVTLGSAPAATEHGATDLTDLTDLADVDPAVVRRTVSFTAEDAHVFTTTVRENLKVARPDADDEELRAVLAQAGLTPWLTALPEGLDTRLGSGGTGISGGERRRLLLARSLLAGAGVLLLDEPAEHLDPATADALVTDVLSRERGAVAADTAAVVVTHRLAPLAAADEVLLLEGGRVVARGTHDWLLDGNSTYRDAWQAEQGVIPAATDQSGR